MNRRAPQEEEIIQLLRLELPLVAHAQPTLLAFLRKRLQNQRIAPRMTVTKLFDAGRHRIK